MKTALYVLLVSALLIGGCYSPREESSAQVGYDFGGIEKVAIVAVEGTIKSEVARDQIAEFFAIELLEHGYAPIGRPQVRRILSRQAAEVNEPAAYMDLSNPEEAVEIGMILKAPAVLTINVPHFGDVISITATMIDVEEGTTLWIAHSSGRGAGVSWLGGEGVQGDDLLSAPPSGPAGPTSGLPLSPEEAEQVRSIIKDVCRSLPVKAVERL